MSKDKITITIKMYGENVEYKMSEKLYTHIKENLIIFKELLPLHNKKNHDERHRFYRSLRSLIFDITTYNFFKTGLMSENTKLKGENTVEDHYYQRTKAVKKIFSELVKNLEMDIETFISLLIRYCSTVTLTKEEHDRVGKFIRKNKTHLNYQVYNEHGIIVEGLPELIKKNFYS
jgi:hypothetical protein